MQAGNVHVVVGGQFGSEAKGATAAFLSRQFKKDSVAGVRIGGSNAGHTVMGKCPPTCDDKVDLGHVFGHHPWRLRHVPVLAVSHETAPLFIAAGSEIDIDVLVKEVTELESTGYRVGYRLFVDSSATVIEPAHIAEEGRAELTSRLGSTAKGVGSARASRAMREACTIRDIRPEMPAMICDTSADLRDWLCGGNHVIIEGTQGYGLGLHTRFYPKTTSGDCRAIDFLAQAGISPWQANETHVWVVIRPNPIRVAGNSGPLADETSWADLRLPEEQTTVTRKTRRVGAWDPYLVNEAIRANGGPAANVHVVLSMLDHLVPGIAGESHGTLQQLSTEILRAADLEVKKISADLHSPIELVGTGPSSMLWCRQPMGIFDRMSPPPSTPNTFLAEIQRMFGTPVTVGFDGANAPRIEQDASSTTNELNDWWMNKAESEIKPLMDKVLEYGGHGAAIDLIEIGTDLGRLMGLGILGTREATELGIYFYVRGKFARWTAALLEERSVSDDTLLDIGVYVRMAQRNREVGGWPYGPEDSDA